MSEKTIQQLRAQHALKHIDNWKNPSSGVRAKNIKSYASDFPAMIMTNGIGQAVAFAMTKKKSEQEYLSILNGLSEWLIKERKIFGSASQPDLVHHLMRCDMQTYQLAQAEAIVYLDWIKKLTKALIQEDGEAA